MACEECARLRHLIREYANFTGIEVVRLAVELRDDGTMQVIVSHARGDDMARAAYMEIARYVNANGYESLPDPSAEVPAT